MYTSEVCQSSPFDPKSIRVLLVRPDTFLRTPRSTRSTPSCNYNFCSSSTCPTPSFTTRRRFPLLPHFPPCPRLLSNAYSIFYWLALKTIARRAPTLVPPDTFLRTSRNSVRVLLGSLSGVLLELVRVLLELCQSSLESIRVLLSELCLSSPELCQNSPRSLCQSSPRSTRSVSAYTPRSPRKPIRVHRSTRHTLRTPVRPVSCVHRAVRSLPFPAAFHPSTHRPLLPRSRLAPRPLGAVCATTHLRSLSSVSSICTLARLLVSTSGRPARASPGVCCVQIDAYTSFDLNSPSFDLFLRTPRSARHVSAYTSFDPTRFCVHLVRPDTFLRSPRSRASPGGRSWKWVLKKSSTLGGARAPHRLNDVAECVGGTGARRSPRPPRRARRDTSAAASPLACSASSACRRRSSRSRGRGGRTPPALRPLARLAPASRETPRAAQVDVDEREHGRDSRSVAAPFPIHAAPCKANAMGDGYVTSAACTRETSPPRRPPTSSGRAPSDEYRVHDLRHRKPRACTRPNRTPSQPPSPSAATAARYGEGTSGPTGPSRQDLDGGEHRGAPSLEEPSERPKRRPRSPRGGLARLTREADDALLVGARVG